jgi:hypothetical protein
LRVQANAAEMAAAVAQENHAGSMKLAADAVAHADTAMDVAGVIVDVRDQVNALFGLVVGEPVQVPGHGGRHAMRAPDQPAIADGTVSGWTE